MSDLENKSLAELVSLYGVAKKCSSGSLNEIRKLIKEKYLAIPEEQRRYFDVDEKDTYIKEILKDA